MRYRAVIFDLFGTLVDSYAPAPYREMLAGMATALGAPSEAFITTWTGTTAARMSGEFEGIEDNLTRICRDLDVSPDATALAAAGRIHLDHARTALFPRPGALQTLREVKAWGHGVGLISNCSWEAPANWPGTPFATFVDTALFSCTERVLKPDPRIYYRCCLRLGVEPQDCLYLDDSGAALEGAARVGMQPVLLRWPEASSPRPDSRDWRGDSIAQLREVLSFL